MTLSIKMTLALIIHFTQIKRERCVVLFMTRQFQFIRALEYVCLENPRKREIERVRAHCEKDRVELGAKSFGYNDLWLRFNIQYNGCRNEQPLVK